MEDILKSIEFLEDLLSAEVDNEDMFELDYYDYSQSMVFYLKDDITLELSLVSPEKGYINTDRDIIVKKSFSLYNSETDTPLYSYSDDFIKHGIFSIESKISVLPYCIGKFKEIQDEVARLSKYIVK